MRAASLVWLAVVLQALCAMFLGWDMITSIFGLRDRPITWAIREMLEIGAIIGLVLGTGLGVIAIRRTDALRVLAERKLRAASGAFMIHVEDRFTEWALTPAERDVALFALKGLSIQNIAQLRATSQGTVKAQTNAIYRKAGVSGRPQLLSLFVEDLIVGDLAYQAQADPNDTSMDGKAVPR